MSKLAFFDNECEKRIDGACLPWVEDDRILNANKKEWIHPDYEETIPVPPESLELCIRCWNPGFSPEEQRAVGIPMLEASIKMLEDGFADKTSTIEKYEIPGCPEEPETPSAVYVVTPENARKKNNRVMFFIPGGGLIAWCAFPDNIDRLAREHNCVVVVPLYRLAFQNEYPAAINDLHAAYKWMAENEDLLHITMSKSMIYGQSSGAHLALALGFRLKRYQMEVRGILAEVPQTDDRETIAESTSTNGWDSLAQHWALKLWLGNNFGSIRVGPEALANHATVKDCIGYPPCIIHTVEFDPDRDNNREFYGKLLTARTYAEYHCWAGIQHQMPTTASPDDDGAWITAYRHLFNANIESLFENDFRRPFVTAEMLNY